MARYKSLILRDIGATHRAGEILIENCWPIFTVIPFSPVLYTYTKAILVIYPAVIIIDKLLFYSSAPYNIVRDDILVPKAKEIKAYIDNAGITGVDSAMKVVRQNIAALLSEDLPVVGTSLKAETTRVVLNIFALFIFAMTLYFTLWK